MKTLLLIDANALIHRSFHALPPLTTPQGEPIQALYGLSRILLKLFREDPQAGGFEYVAALFDRPEPTFRKQKYIEYKAQRPKSPDELISQIIKAHEVFEKFGVKTYEIPGFEADDLIGTLAHRFNKNKDVRVVILTGDLDALQLVEGDKVVVRTFKKGISDTMVYNEEQVIARYGLRPEQLPDYKALSGDPSDNIPGIRGIGPKTTSALLKKYGTLTNIFKELKEGDKLYDKFKDKKEEAALFRELATIDRGAPLEVSDLEELKKNQLDVEVLTDYFKVLGFESLVKELLGAPSSPKTKRDAGGESRQLTFL